MPSDKDEVAEELVRWHFRVEPGLVTIYRVIGANEDDPKEPIKLVEVNEDTIPTGSFAAFGFAPTDDVPFPTLIAEVTPAELDEWRRTGGIPEGWDLDRAKKFDRSAA